MKKGWKIFWITCAALTMTGLLLCTAAFCIGIDWQKIKEKVPGDFKISTDWRPGGRLHYKEGEVTGSNRKEDETKTFQNVREIEVEADANAVEILSADTEEVTVETRGLHKNTRTVIREEEGTLHVEAKVKKWMMWFGNRQFQNGKIIIRVPKNSRMEEVSVAQDTGTLRIEGIRTEELSVDMSAGEGTLSQVWATGIDVGCSAGKISVSGHVEESLDLNCGVGEIEADLDGTQEEYGYEVECGVGEVEIGNKSFTALSREETAEGTTEKNISAECGVGTIRVTFNGQKQQVNGNE